MPHLGGGLIVPATVHHQAARKFGQKGRSAANGDKLFRKNACQRAGTGYDAHRLIGKNSAGRVLNMRIVLTIEDRKSNSSPSTEQIALVETGFRTSLPNEVCATATPSTYKTPRFTVRPSAGYAGA